MSPNLGWARHDPHSGLAPSGRHRSRFGRRLAARGHGSHGTLDPGRIAPLPQGIRDPGSSNRRRDRDPHERKSGHDPHDQAATILSVLTDVSDDLDGGAVVVVVGDRVRVRSLPME